MVAIFQGARPDRIREELRYDWASVDVLAAAF